MMTTQQTPTYVGFHKASGLWAFSPSMIGNVDFVWDVSHWEFQQIQDLMQMPSDKDRLVYLTSQLGMPLEMNRDYLSELKGN